MHYGKVSLCHEHLSVRMRVHLSSRRGFCFFEPCKKERRRMRSGTPFHTLLIRQTALRKLRLSATFSHKRRPNRDSRQSSATVRGIKSRHCGHLLTFSRKFSNKSRQAPQKAKKVLKKSHKCDIMSLYPIKREYLR